MRHSLLAVVIVTLAAGASAGASTAGAQSSNICFTAKYSCLNVTVPLDRSGAVTGTTRLAVIRRQAGAAPSSTAVVPIAGGPGQAATPLATDLASALKTELRGRDMLVFDQRGTGASAPLSCGALASSKLSGVGAVQHCADALGRLRGLYTTADSVADLEAVRVASGYDKLVLYGVSYGTRLAMDYASAYPQHVAGLILDSVVPQTGVDPYSRSTIQALPAALADLCATACRAFTASPSADLTRLVGRLHAHPLTGRVLDAAGHRVRASLTEGLLLEGLIEGDLDPSTRATIPGLVHAALRGDTQPILRLASALESSGSDGGGGDELGIDSSLYLATTCEENPFPWSRATTSVRSRATQAAAATRTVPAAAVAPFDAATALGISDASTCVGWTPASPAPAVPAPLPDVPTLVLEGRGDLRTPVEDARRAVAGIPGAQILVVPRQGHSVLTTDQTGCASAALAAFSAGRPVVACTVGKDSNSAATPPPPERLADVPRLGGIAGVAGRTAGAVRLTILDAAAFVGADIGGLRGGSVRIDGQAEALVLDHDSYVPGVVVSGSISFAGGTSHVTVSGSEAAPGTLTISKAGRAAGTLGGHRIVVALAASAGSAFPTAFSPAWTG